MSPSRFVVEWVERLARDLHAPAAHRRALDVAMGRGRHAIALARAGFRTFGVDANWEALRSARAAATEANVSIAAWCADLTHYPLPVARFDVVIVTRYLQRDLFSALRDAVVPGGFLLYETFTTAQRALNSGPTSPHHLLEPDELRAIFDVPGWETLAYEEISKPEAVAQLAAVRLAADR